MNDNPKVTFGDDTVQAYDFYVSIIKFTKEWNKTNVYDVKLPKTVNPEEWIGCIRELVIETVEGDVWRGMAACQDVIHRDNKIDVLFEGVGEIEHKYKKNKAKPATKPDSCFWDYIEV